MRDKRTLIPPIGPVQQTAKERTVIIRKGHGERGILERESRGSSVIIDWAFDKSQQKSLGTGGIPQWLTGKEFTCNAGDPGHAGLIPGLRRSPEEKMATHSSIFAWEIPWTEYPGGLQSKELQRVGCN